MIFEDGTRIPIEYDGVLPFIPIRCPTNDEIHSSRRLALSPRYDWDPKLLHGTFSRVNVLPSAPMELGDLIDGISADDPISAELMSNHISEFITSQSLLQLSGDDTYQSSLALVGTTKSNAITPEFLSRQLHIGLPIASRTLNATTHQFIHSTGSLTRRFHTDKAQLRYKQLAKVHGSFYCDYLKISVPSLRGFIGGVLYTNKLSFLKFVPCVSETSETGQTFQNFLEIVGLPYVMPSDNHKNFSEGLF